MKKVHLFIIVAQLLNFSTVAQSVQKKCISHEKYIQKLEHNFSFSQERERIENFTKTIQQSDNKKTTQTIYRIPVVVHVIHNGESMGVGQNISDEQILSQITVINEDFRNLNTNKLVAEHPFTAVIADSEIEFCLAEKDEFGETTSGITRHNLGKDSWTYDETEATVKTSTAWDRTKYLNIWIVTLGGDDEGTLGYATFPGTEDATDGIVIVGKYFGTLGTVEFPYHLGRTATHEIGHYFNLLHIWGDENCGDDKVDDTKPQNESNTGCPTFPHNNNSGCGSGVWGEMFMNYMDYSDDACLSMFTNGQKSRMRAAIEGARKSLLSSPGCSAFNSIADVLENQIKLYPNPASNVVYVTFDKPVDLKSLIVYDIKGKNITHLVNYEITNQSVILKTENLSSGNYFLTLFDDQKITNQLFTILN